MTQEEQTRRDAEFEKRRTDLYSKIAPGHFQWDDLKLLHGNVLQVSRPLKVDGIFVPVRARETFELAKRFAAFPLTRAVADQCFGQFAHIPYRNQSLSDLKDFDAQSKYLNSVDYNSGKKFGAHKLWVLSSLGKAINYGFYVQNAKKKLNPNYYLQDDWSVIQPLSVAHDHHDREWWDYSQLLQLMRAPGGTLQLGPREVSLATAILEGSRYVWDEPKKLASLDVF